MTTRQYLESELNQLMQPQLFKDYGPNGLQVQGRDQVTHVVSGVTASLALIEAAIEAKADAILVHHGLFWRGQTGVVTGWMRKRLGLLMAHDINLFAYHLPLDAHATLGNNAQLGLKLGLAPQNHCGDQNMVWVGQCAPQTLQQLRLHVEMVLGRPAIQLGVDAHQVQRVAWCTGGAQGYFEAAIEAGVDVFITGELSEPQAHYARECGVAYLACGHHATERYGVQAVGAQVAQTLGISHRFIDIDNPA